jgi:RND family efflux transporter MFP subunit
MRAKIVASLVPLFLAILWTIGMGPCHGMEVEAVTKPSADIDLSFVRVGRIAEVLVKEGDAVKAGQLLASQDDKVEQIQLLQLKAKAVDRTRIEAAAADLLQKQEDLKKIEGAKKKGAATDWEVEHARLNVKIAELSVQMAKFEHEQDRGKYDEARADLERLRLLSPVAGLVEEVSVEPGESAQPMKAAVRIIQIDPLWIDVIAPLGVAHPLKPGKTCSVFFPGQETPARGKGVEGRIIFVSAVSKAASDTLRVRVEVANPGRRPAGERVAVSFPGLSITSVK